MEPAPTSESANHAAARRRLAAAAGTAEIDALDLLRRLVAAPSVVGRPDAIAACLDLVHDAVAPFAREIRRPVHDGLPALVAHFGNGPADRLLSIVGHVDVVPAHGAWSSHPFGLSECNDRLVGRGVVDMKGGVAAAAAAIRALAAAELLDRCALELVVTGDEEVGSERGVRALLAAGDIAGSMAVCPEPTGLDVYLGNRGVVAWEIVVHGRGGHAGVVHALASPIGPALGLCQAIEALPLVARDERFSPPTPSLAITKVDAGATVQATNVVPDSVTVVVDRRVLPGEAIATVTAEIERIVAKLIRPPWSAEVRTLKQWPPCATDADHPVVRAAVAGARAAGRSGALGMDNPANDSSWLVEHGIPAILFGPGDPEQAHATDESLSRADLRDGVVAYAAMALAAATLPAPPTSSRRSTNLGGAYA